MDISYAVSPAPAKGKAVKHQHVQISSAAPIICCVECKQMDSTLPYTICLECFWKGAEKKDDAHRNYHDYYVMDRLDYPVFNTNWSAVDELQLLKGISQSGIDNWHEMAENQNTKRKGDECASHFYSFYFKSKEDPVPKSEDVVSSRWDALTFQVKIKKDRDEQNI